MIVLHHDDADGRCAAWVVSRAEKNCTFIEMDYRRPVPMDRIADGDEVCIVDFSLSPDDMDTLRGKGCFVIWVDHHKTAIEKYDGYAGDIAGIRDTSESGALLAWRYFMPDEPVPWIVRYVSDYDTWRHRWEESRWMHTALALHDCSPSGGTWDMLCEIALPPSGSPDPDTPWGSFLSKGKLCLDYLKRLAESWVDELAWVTEVDGYSVLALGTAQRGSDILGGEKAMEVYDILCAYRHDGRGFQVSLYSDTKVDVGSIAARFGGGGHRGAAGFQCTELPFKPLEPGE